MGSSLINPDKNLHTVRQKDRVLCSARGYRQTQEDGHVMKQIDKGVVMCAVFDGHGGHTVSRFLEDKFCDFYKEAKQTSKTTPIALKKAIADIDLYIYEHNDDLAKYLDTTLPIDPSVKLSNGAGSTAVIAIIDSNTHHIYISNVGDSQAIITDLDNELACTVSHDYENTSDRA